MKIPFVSFKPMERELNKELREAFDRVFERSWYIEGKEDEEFEIAFAQYCDSKYCVGVGNGLDALMLALKAMTVLYIGAQVFITILSTHPLMRLSVLLTAILTTQNKRSKNYGYDNDTKNSGSPRRS